MVLTVTLNPLLEKRLFFDKIDFGSSNRNGKLILNAGGKGINVSRQLNLLKVKNIVLTFTGGENGKKFRSILKEEQIEFASIYTQAETREGYVIFGSNHQKPTYLFITNSLISKNESDEFKDKLEKMIRNCEIVVFSGSSPCKNTDDIFPFGIETANKHDKISICDTYGSHLKKCIQASPTIIHNNLDELKSSLGIQLVSDEQAFGLMDEFYSGGIKQSFITNGEKKFYASNFDFHYEVQPLSVNTIDATGSGDAFVAGLVYGLFNDMTFDKTLRFASVLGAMNAQTIEVCKSIPDADSVLPEKIVITPVGKKVKTVDDSPN
ncbi:MAG: 1-phosphofructokinase [Ignavibacteriaceae bacterium]|nr:1-phosphofructokinase [Ignavibacteriaceae bacterium]